MVEHNMLKAARFRGSDVVIMQISIQYYWFGSIFVGTDKIKYNRCHSDAIPAFVLLQLARVETKATTSLSAEHQAFPPSALHLHIRP